MNPKTFGLAWLAAGHALFAPTAGAQTPAPPASLHLLANVSSPQPAPVLVYPPFGLALRVDAWARSPDPADALRAYETAARCAEALHQLRSPRERRLEDEEARLGQDVAGWDRPLPHAITHHQALWCGDLNADQIDARLAWLARAAAAGVPGAARDFIAEGPGGQGPANDPFDPPPGAWLARRNEAIEIALQHCDTSVVRPLAYGARPPEVSVEQATRFWRSRLRCDPADAPEPLAGDPRALGYLSYLR